MSERFATGEPRTRDEIAVELARFHDEAERFVAELPTADFLAAQGDRWSPADHLRHLAKSTFPVARALGLPRIALLVLFGPARRPPRPFVEIREKYRARLADGVTAGRFAPEPRAVAADDEAWRERVMDRWREADRSLRQRIGRWREPALDRCRLPHPALGKLSVREMLFFTLYHGAHHLNLVARRRSQRGAAGSDGDR